MENEWKKNNIEKKNVLSHIFPKKSRVFWE